jgi:hypothetical protein
VESQGEKEVRGVNERHAGDTVLLGSNERRRDNTDTEGSCLPEDHELRVSC